MKFEAMCRGWIIGTRRFAKELVEEHRELAGQGSRLATEVQVAREAIWLEKRDELLLRLDRTPVDLEAAGKSVPWKLAVAAGLKTTTTATNRWLALNLHLGNMHEASRKVAAWIRNPDPTLLELMR